MVALISPLILGVALLGSPSVDVHSVAAEPHAAVTLAQTQTAQVEAPPADAPAQVSSGLPPQPEWPLTMRAYWPVFAVFAIIWVGIIGYILSFGGRIRRVADSITDLEPDGSSPAEGVVPR